MNSGTVNNNKIKIDDIFTNPGLFKDNNSVMILLDPVNCIILDVNDAAFSFYGYTKEELLKKEITDINVLSKEQIKNDFELVLKGEQKHFNYRHRVKSGEVRDVEVHRINVKIDGKDVIFSIVYDITEQKKAEEKIRKTNDELNQIFNSVSDGMRVIDKDFNVTRVNEKILALSGLGKKEDAEGKKCYNIFPGEYCHTEKCPLVIIKNGEDRVEYEVEKRILGRGLVSFIITATPILSPEGELMGIVEDFKDISKQKRDEKTIEFLAFHDNLTKLPNRMLFNKELSKIISQNNSGKLAVLFLDLDGFKNINDTFGHELGDELLEQVSNLFLELTDNNCIVSRFGGDEFNILIPNVQSLDEVTFIANNLIKGFEKPFIIRDYTLHVSTSIGISLFPKDGKDADGLISKADMAMYRAKERGKNNYQFYSSELNSEVLRNHQIKEKLQHAIERNELSILYQPKIDILNRNVIGFEALVRWNDKDLGIIAFEELMQIADTSELTFFISRWILQKVAEQIQLWRKETGQKINISINFTIKQLRQKHFIEMVKSIIIENNIHPSSLEFEVAEDIVISNTNNNLKIIQTLKRIGVKFTLDHFGKGNISLIHLKQLPIDIIKIDKSFIDELLIDIRNMAIADAISTMAHHLNIRVLADGVETEEQIKILYDINCDYIQGNVFSEPLTTNDIECKGVLNQLQYSFG